MNPPAINENGALRGIKDNAHTSEAPQIRGAAQGPQRLLAQSSENSGHDARAGGDPNPMKKVYARLADVGFSRAYVRRLILPDWWDDEAATTPAGLAEAILFIVRHTGIDYAALRDGTSPAKLIARVEAEHTPDAREPRIASFGDGPSEAPDLRPGDWIHIGDQRFCVVQIGDEVSLRGVRGGAAWLRQMPRGGWRLSRAGAWARAVRW